MKNVQLQFDSLLNLWCFKEKAQLSELEIVSSRRLLIADLPDALISLAVQHYNARIFALAVHKNAMAFQAC